LDDKNGRIKRERAWLIRYSYSIFMTKLRKTTKLPVKKAGLWARTEQEYFGVRAGILTPKPRSFVGLQFVGS
jgi:hypothetical protein